MTYISTTTPRTNRLAEIENELNKIADSARFQEYCGKQYKSLTKPLLLQACEERGINVKKTEKKEALLQALNNSINNTIEILDNCAIALMQERDELRKVANQPAQDIEATRIVEIAEKTDSIYGLEPGMYYIYASASRPMSASWARIADALFVNADPTKDEAYTWIVVPALLDDRTIASFELTYRYGPVHYKQEAVQPAPSQTVQEQAPEPVQQHEDVTDHCSDCGYEVEKNERHDLSDFPIIYCIPCGEKRATYTPVDYEATYASLDALEEKRKQVRENLGWFWRAVFTYCLDKPVQSELDRDITHLKSLEAQKDNAHQAILDAETAKVQPYIDAYDRAFHTYITTLVALNEKHGKAFRDIWNTWQDRRTAPVATYTIDNKEIEEVK